MSNTDVPTLLNSLAAFSNLNQSVREKAVAILQECGSIEDIAEEKTLFSDQDTNIDSGVVVLSGTFRVHKPDGFEIEGEGPELLGEMGIINPSQRRTATVLATSPIKALRFSWAAFEAKTKQVFTESDQEVLKAAIKEYAWNHFVG